MPFSVEITEALALQEGVLLASEMGLSKVIFEGDALSIIQAVNEGNVGGDFGHIIQNIRDLSFSFTWCLFQHLNRNGNRVAHDLAKEARRSGVSQVWKGVVPSVVENLICNERGL